MCIFEPHMEHLGSTSLHLPQESTFIHGIWRQVGFPKGEPKQELDIGDVNCPKEQCLVLPSGGVVVHMQPHAPENKGKGDELPMCASQTPACAMAQHRERVRCLNLMHRKWNAECTYKIGKKHTSLMLGYENTLGTAWNRQCQASSKGRCLC